MKAIILYYATSYVTEYRRAFVIVGGTALVTLILFATGPTAIPEETTEKAWPITVMDVKPAYLRPSFSVFGRYEANQRAACYLVMFLSVKEKHDEKNVRSELVCLQSCPATTQFLRISE